MRAISHLAVFLLGSLLFFVQGNPLRRDVSALGYPSFLKQTTRQEVIERSTRTRPRRATISGGGGAPPFGGTFVIRTHLPFAVNSYVGMSGNTATTKSSLADAPLFVLVKVGQFGAVGNLARVSDGYIASGEPVDTATGFNTVTFLPPDSFTSGSSMRPIECYVTAGSDQLACSMTVTPRYLEVGFTDCLGMLGVIKSGGYTICDRITLSAHAAIP